MGVLCLSGLREYESGCVNVDLLCVYDEREVLELESSGVVVWVEKVVSVSVSVSVVSEGWEYGEELGCGEGIGLGLGEGVDVEELGCIKEDEEVNIDEI